MDFDPEDMPIGDVWTGKQPAVVDVFAPQDHPVNAWLERWVDTKPYARIRRSVDELEGGDFLFLISCGEIVPAEVRERYRHALVIHASNLPKDRGWSPHIWTLLAGGNELTVSLLTCTDPVDSGDIWHQERILLDGTEMFDEINAQLFDAELRLMDWALRYCDSSNPAPQLGVASYRRKRTPEDSRVSPDQTVSEIFDLLRVCDPDRYPAFFEHRGRRYALNIKRL